MPRAERDGDLIVVETRWTEKDLIKLIPGSRWDADGRRWTLPLTWPACLQLRGVFPDALDVGPDLTAWSWDEFTQRVTPSTELRTALTWPLRDGLSPRLYDFQVPGVRFLLTAGDALLGDQMGTGKTIQALEALRLLPDGLPALVICPNAVKRSWVEKAAEWCPGAVPYVVTGGAVGRRKILRTASDDPAALVVINTEAVRLLSRLAGYGSIRLARCRECDPRGEEVVTPARCEVHPRELNGFGFRTVVLDEAHWVKDPRSKQTRACWAVGSDPSVRRRWALTGTPIANHVGDLWSVMHFIAPSEHPTKSKFVDRYGLQSWNAYGGLDVVGLNPVNRAEFHAVTDPRFRRVTKAEVLPQLPPKIRSQRWVELTTNQRRVYRELEDQLVAFMPDGEVLVTPDNLVKATRLLQLSSSFAEVKEVPVRLTVLSKCRCYGAGLDEHSPDCRYGIEIRVTLCEPSPKLDEVEVVLEELGDEQVVITAESRQLIDLLARRLDRHRTPYGLITGAVSEYDRDRARETFSAGGTRLMLMTLGAGGTGLDGLQCARNIIFIQRSWKMITNVQGEDRTHRIGSEVHDAVHVIDIIARDTIEDRVQWPRLAAKLERLEEITRDRERLRASGVDVDAEYDRIVGSDLGEL